LLKVPPEELTIANGQVVSTKDPKKRISLKRVAGTAHWNHKMLPEDMEPGLQARGTFRFPMAGPPDAQDRVNSSNTYGFMAEIAVVEVDRDTGAVDHRSRRRHDHQPRHTRGADLRRPVARAGWRDVRGDGLQR
jgi:2-furoyl-CoA dehydrogenase large subunit